MNFSFLRIIPFIAFGLCPIGAAAADPQVLDTPPPSDAGRGLIRVSATEIRHYGGGAKEGKTLPLIVSKDNGETWTKEMAGDKFPKKWGGIFKEAAAIAYLPKCKKFIMVQPIRGYIFMADDLDGEWVASPKSGKKMVESDVWMKNQSSLYSIGGVYIYRTPLELSNGRIIIPMHERFKGTKFLISDDEGISWKESKEFITVPEYQEKGIDLAPRWRNAGVEGTAVELKNGTVYAIVRTDSNWSYEAYSKDKGNTWSKPEKSPFYGSLIMTTLGRLKNGKLICLTTNTSPLPELAHKKGSQWEDVFTGRGALHVAFSEDEGKSWYGYREVLIDKMRNSSSFASHPGDHDRSCHQAEFVELDDQRILITGGQQDQHRKMIIIDQDWVGAASRVEDIDENGLDNIHSHVFIPKINHIQYNRKQGAELVDGIAKGEKKAIKFGILNDDELTATNPDADYRRSGVTWNFPNSMDGEVYFNIQFPKGSQGCYVSLTDRMLNPCDTSAPERAVFSIKLAPGSKLGKTVLKSDSCYEARLRFRDSKCALYLNGAKVATANVKCKNPTKVGINYLHFIAAEDPCLKSSRSTSGDSPFFQFEKAGEMEEKSTIVSGFKMRGKNTK
ncbi:MAG: sialidase family protein [Akkermansia sp.]